MKPVEWPESREFWKMFQQRPDLAGCLLAGDDHQGRLSDHLALFSVINLVGTCII
jgi:hypothetical protein